MGRRRRRGLHRRSALLADAGEVDSKRLSISGGSAGGFTCSWRSRRARLRGGDLRVRRHRPRPLRRDDAQVRGALPGLAARAAARRRSTSTATARRSSTPTRSAPPVLITQGLDDKVVPPSQAEADRRGARAERRSARLPAAARTRGTGTAARVARPQPAGGALVPRAGVRLRACGRRRAARDRGSRRWESPSSRATPSTSFPRARSSRS